MSPGDVEDFTESRRGVSPMLTSHCQQLQVGEDNLSIAITPFSNRFLVIVSAYGKIGHLLDISRESIPFETPLVDNTGDNADSTVISIERLLGAENENVEVAGRYIAEKIMAKANGRVNSVLLGISLREYGKAVINECTEKVLSMV
ncbi:proteasome assembly chaperone 3-like [Tropilaelaps mercedesae]|uniref:Proteasome assembly chaperone 3-like n=1 Tax=Tropilaelaps mercedesae TaxID=418985 RepID=A0A1V9XE50_9ACAR|nr:proteasome assembly chaperone 3-like [Tropilaelaps mercedesae]